MIGDLHSVLADLSALRLRRLDCQSVAILASLPITLFTTWLIARAIYRIWFHPLSKYPGPWYAAATNFTYWAISSKGEQHNWCKALHDKYGEVVRIGPARISYISPQAWRDIHGRPPPGRASVKKDPWFYGGPLDIGGEASMLTEFDDAKHAAIRKIFNSAFSEKALRQQQDLLLRHANRLIALLRKKIVSEEKLDAVSFYNYTTFDVMGDLTLGDDLGMLTQGKLIPWVSQIFDSNASVLLLQPLMRWPGLARFLSLFVPKFVLAAMKRHVAFVTDRVDARIERGSEQPDIWNLVLAHTEEEKAKREKSGEEEEGVTLTRNAMYSNASIFMMAGTETTATQLAGVTYYLLKNPDKMARLVKEIRGLSGEGELTVDNLPRLEYLRACLEEALRIYPPVPMGAPRLVPEGGATVCGDYLPGGTRVSVNQWAANHAPTNFKDPDTYVPERWLPGSGYDSDRKEAMQAFSYGPRNCLGKNLSYHEMRLILCKVLWHFDLELCAESDNWPKQKVYNLWQKQPLWVKLTPVQREVS